MKTKLEELKPGDAICFKYGFDYHTRKVVGNNGKIISWMLHSTIKDKTYEEMEKQDWSYIGYYI